MKKTRNSRLLKQTVKKSYLIRYGYRIANFIRNSVFVFDQALLKAEACHAERMISECISLFAFRKSYFDDNSFEQYAELDDDMVLFSLGTYSFANEGDFNYDPDEKNFGDIIERTHKLTADKDLAEYSSSHTYPLGSLGFTKIYPANE